LNSAHLHVSSSDKTPGGFSPSSSKVINASSAYEYYVIKVAMGGGGDRLKKQNLSIALLNTGRQGKLLKRTPTYKDTFYIMHLITPWNTTWQHVQEMDKNNGNSCERYTPFSKANQSDSMIFKLGDCASQRRY
jgi:hypothetical protein